MRELNENLKRRFVEELRKADALEHRKRPDVPADEPLVDESTIADRMAEFLHSDKHSVRKQLARYLHKGHIWRADYIQAMARSFGLDPAEVCWIDVTKRPDVPEAHRAQILVAAVAERLDLSTVRRAARTANRLLDMRPRFDLMLDIADSLVEAKDLANAQQAVFGLLATTTAIDPKSRDLRVKRPASKNRTKSRRLSLPS